MSAFQPTPPILTLADEPQTDAEHDGRHCSGHHAAHQQRYVERHLRVLRGRRIANEAVVELFGLLIVQKRLLMVN